MANVNASGAIAAARREVGEEDQARAVKLLKSKLRELSAAQTVVGNVEREIADLEQSIEDGNF